MAIYLSDHWLPTLEAAGLADENTKRVVLDFQCGEIPVVYIERFADDKVLSVIQTLEGVEIRRDEVKPENGRILVAARRRAAR